MALTNTPESSASSTFIDRVDLVLGFIHKMESLLPNQIIPSEIKQLCLMYYHLKERFTKCGTELCISSNINKFDTCTVQRSNPNHFSWWNTVYGKIVIDGTTHRNGVYWWRFKLIQINAECVIGITTCTDHSNRNGYDPMFSNKPSKFYALSTAKKPLISHRFELWNYHDECHHAEPFKANDIIVMELDTKDRILKYYQNGNEIGSIDNIDMSVTYNVAISMQSRSLSRDCICIQILQLGIRHTVSQPPKKRLKMGWFD
eukprot:239068_1